MAMQDGVELSRFLLMLVAGYLFRFLVPAATLWVLVYGCMRWKGLKFSDLMYVTKENMACSVTNFTKRLEQVSEALPATERHLTQQISNLEDKMEKQNEMSTLIGNDVCDVQKPFRDIFHALNETQRVIQRLDGKLDTFEDKQDLINGALQCLCECNCFNGRVMSEGLKEQLEDTEKSQSSLKYSDTSSMKVCS